MKARSIQAGFNAKTTAAPKSAGQSGNEVPAIRKTGKSRRNTLMTKLTQQDLKRYFAAYPAQPPRTTALEQKIKIGTGFHKKWYRSQKEHWLGWLIAKDCEVRAKGNDPATTDARIRYQFIMCSPAMFWIAESAGVSPTILDAAEDMATQAAKINDKDGQPHGKMMRQVLSWSVLEAAILSGPSPVSLDEAETTAREAFERLCEKRGEFRKLKVWLR